MSAQLVNMVSSIAFVVVLSLIIWWLRIRPNHWASADGTRCFCQITLALTGTAPKWIEVRIVIDTANAVVTCKSRGKRGRTIHGLWNVIGEPHSSHIGTADSGTRTYALSRRDDADALAMLRIPIHSRSVSVLDALLPR
jgi:hypothetical protein